MYVLVAIGLQNPLCVGPVGLVSRDVGTHLMRWKQDDLMAEGVNPPAPVRRGTARFTTIEGRKVSKNAMNFDRGRRAPLATSPGISETAISKIDFARSTATTVRFSMGSSFEHGLNHDLGTLMPIRSRLGGSPSHQLQLTKAARSGRLRSLIGRSLRAAFAAEPECWTGHRGASRVQE